VIIPAKEKIDCTAREYTDTMTYIFNKVFPFVDNNCKDPARIYYGHFGSEVFYLNGNKTFDFYKYKSISEKIKEIEQNQRKNTKPTTKPQYKEDGTKADWYRKNWLNDAMKRALKIDDKFVSGSRNTTLFSYARYFKDMNFTDDEVKEATFWINNGELSDNEIATTIFRSLRLAQ
jgi:hypothetical protein